MTYRRTGRPSWYFEAKTREGFKQVCTWTPDKKLADRIEHMWSELATRFRAWDLLDPAIKEPKKIGALYDLWVECRYDVEAMRRKRAEVDVEPLVAEWHAVYLTRVAKDTAEHALAHVRHFFPEGTPRLSSSVTADWITAELTSYAGKRNTLRKVHSSLSGFLDYLVMPKRLFAASPMLHVARPALERATVAFYDGGVVARIVVWQPSAVRAAFFALVYGTGADVSPALVIDKSDINPATKEVRIAGTKTATRDRVVRVSEVLWPTFWKHAKTVLAGRVFPSDWNRWTVSDWHRQTVGAGVKDTHGEVEREGLGLNKRLPLRKARHHFAVRLLSAGAAVRVVSEQLGTDERTVLKHYGPWITSPDDRARAEKLAGQHESRQRKAGA